MFLFKSLQAPIPIENERAFGELVRSLEDSGYRALFSSMTRGAQAALPGDGQISIDSLLRARYFGADEQMVGEFIFKDDSLFVLLPRSDKLIVIEIRHHMAPESIGGICTAVQDANIGRSILGQSMLEWGTADAIVPRRPARLRRRNRGEVALDTKPVDYSDLDLDRAILLADDVHRQQLMEIAKVGKIRASDARIAPPVLDALQQKGVIVKEYLITCRKDSHTICTVADKDRLAQPEIADLLKCPACSRKFEDELISEIYSIGPAARELLNGSRWMTIWVTDLLEKAGISREFIKWNAQAAEDEIDIVIEVPRARVFVELKDRDFGVGDAYPFVLRLERYSGNVGVVLTMGHVSDEARRFLEERRKNPEATIFEMLEGAPGIAEGLPKTMESVSRWIILTVVDEAFTDFGIDVRDILTVWMDRVANSAAPQPATQGNAA